MTPAEILAARKALGLSQTGLAEALRLTTGDRTVRNWESGRVAITGPASLALEALVSGWEPSAKSKAEPTRAFKMMMDGVNDAIAFAEGDHSRGRAHHFRSAKTVSKKTGPGLKREKRRSLLIQHFGKLSPDTLISEVGFSLRAARRLLEQPGIVTLRDVATLSWSELLRIPGLGRLTCLEIGTALNVAGLARGAGWQRLQ